MSREHPRRKDSAPEAGWALPAMLCVALAIAHTWPLATAPATLSRNDNGDAQLNEWILAWVDHTLPRDPLHLFQANIFYPAHDTLAFSEPLIVPALLGAPLAWLGGSPVLVFNLTLLAGFALTALAGYRLMFAWTRDRAAALLTGSTFAFNTHTLTRLPHVQAIHLYGLPLALLAADRLVTTPRTRDAWWLAFWLVVMAYTSGYLFLFGAVMIAVTFLVRAVEWWPRCRAVALRVTLAGLVAAAAIVPLWLPYHRVAAEQGMVRSLAAVGEYSASPRSYLAAAGRLHRTLWSARLVPDPPDCFFPGAIIIILALVAVGALFRRDSPDASRPRVTMLLAVAATGFVLSLGTRTPMYGWLYSVLPPLRGLRAAARFGNLFLLAMSGLAGLGLAHVRARARIRAGRLTVVAVSLVLVANLEALRAPFEYRHFTGIPPIYRLLADEPHVVLAEVPFYPRQAPFENAEYVLNSTAHWRPLMNGYSGYTPESYMTFADVFRYFPRNDAIDAMRRAEVTHVMVHPERLSHDGDDVFRQLSARSDLELMAIGAHGLRLYRLH